jgi:hypothetical protein
MKKLSFFILLFCSFNTFAQTPKKDTIYYLIDTTKTPVKDRMWEIGEEGPLKYYSFRCACLKYNLSPTFIYNLKNEGKFISMHDLKSINLITLAKLIDFSRENLGDSFNNKHIAYFIEPNGKEFVMHKVRLIQPRKREPTIDSEIIKPDSGKTVNH